MLKIVLIAATALCWTTSSLAQTLPVAAFPSVQHHDDSGYRYNADEQLDRPPPVIHFEEPFREVGESEFLFRAGPVLGIGYTQDTCTGDCDEEQGDKTRYSQSASIQASADWLMNPAYNFRWGLGFSWTSSHSIRVNGHDDMSAIDLKLGPSYSTYLLLEPIFDVSDNTAISIRGQLGMGLWTPGEKISDAADQLSNKCNQISGSDMSCDVSKPPYFGFNAGLGPAFIVDMSSYHLRVDLQAQVYVLPTLKTSFQWDGKSAEVSHNYIGNQLALTVGIEL